jgi:hypothetical protein
LATATFAPGVSPQPVEASNTSPIDSNAMLRAMIGSP